MRRAREVSLCRNSKGNRRFPLLLVYILLVLGVLGSAHGQCTAPAAGGAAPPEAPTLNSPILVGAGYVSGTAKKGNTVVICVNGSPAGTAAVAVDGSFQVAMTASLVEGQQVTAQQYAPAGSPVYSALSAVVPVTFEIDTCLEALESGVCQFRIQIDTSGAIGNGSQTNTS